jgi:hypothetical protein
MGPHSAAHKKLKFLLIDNWLCLRNLKECDDCSNLERLKTTRQSMGGLYLFLNHPSPGGMGPQAADPQSGRLSADRIQELNAIGSQKNTRIPPCEERWKKSSKPTWKQGKDITTCSLYGGHSLGPWINAQAHSPGKGILAADLIEKLNACGLFGGSQDWAEWQQTPPISPTETEESTPKAFGMDPGMSEQFALVSTATTTPIHSNCNINC